MGSFAPAIDIHKALDAAQANHQAGRLTEAEIVYRQVLAIQPDNFVALNMLGLIAYQAGSSELAIELIGKAVALDQSNAIAYNNFGEVYRSLNRHDEAIACFQRALTLQPDYVEAHNNLGNVFKNQGRPDQAIACYQKALALKPDYAEAYNNLGCVFNDQGKLDESLACFQKALILQPNYADAHTNCSIVQIARGQYSEALENIRHTFRIKETAQTRNLFVQVIPYIRLLHDDAEIRHLMSRALSDPWSRPADLAQSAISFIKMHQPVKECIERATAAWPARLAAPNLFGVSGPASISGDQLLLRLLENTPASDLDMEKFLTMARYYMLKAAIEGKMPEATVLAFYCALARQCFINEFVFSYMADELNQAKLLRGKLAASLEAAATIPVLWLVAVGAYFPLHSLPQAQNLFHQYWPDAVSALLAQQVKEPLEERQSRAGMPGLTSIEDSVSLLVQQQYEENPYPRWTKAPLSSTVQSIDSYLRTLFPLAPFQPLGQKDEVEILVAGCGTGQQPIATATGFCGVQVTAIDLSLSSLCYAQRKTREMGIENIQYAQADIMKLGETGRTFDIIECGGVLHHLADPEAGLKILLSLLRPGGFVNLGLYSEAARQHIVAARRFIVEQGYAAHTDDIRQCRQELISTMETNSLLKRLLSFRDFFSTSECRDLIFHVQEHRFTLPQIKKLLEDMHLDFIGFTIEPMTKKRYQQRFPDDVSMRNLDDWHIFETENPDTFYAMYQFWAQKPP